MRHMIGGFAFGVFFALVATQPGKDRPLAMGMFGLLFALMSWGLLP